MALLAKTHPTSRFAFSESNQRIHHFLKTHPIGVLATVDPNGNPHAAVVYFTIDETFTVTFTTKRDTKKHDNLVHNSHAMLVAYDAASQTTVQVIAVAEEVTDVVETEAVIAAVRSISMTTSDAGLPPISKLEAGQYVAYRLKPEQIRMAIFARPGSGGYDIFETIDFEP